MICTASIQERFPSESVFMDHSLLVFLESQYNSRYKNLSYIFFSVSPACCNVNDYSLQVKLTDVEKKLYADQYKMLGGGALSHLYV